MGQGFEAWTPEQPAWGHIQGPRAACAARGQRNKTPGSGSILSATASLAARDVGSTPGLGLSESPRRSFLCSLNGWATCLKRWM